jgi:hypothetical protein
MLTNRCKPIKRYEGIQQEGRSPTLVLSSLN